MRRLVVELFSSQENGGELSIEFRVTDPPEFDSPALKLSAKPADAEFVALKQASFDPEAVKRAGQRLFEALASSAKVADLLTAALQALPDEHCPVYLQIKASAGVEDLPWETLCSRAGEFLALDERWGLGREVASVSPTPPSYAFAPPLRIAAILSCLDEPAGNELAALRDAISKAPGLPTEMLVVTSEESLHKEISDAKAPGIQVRMVPADLLELEEMVKEFEPHIMHFFCHGSTAAEPHLQVATKESWITHDPKTILALGAKEFRRFARETGPRPWLLVLNACESAANASQENLQSLASRILYYGAAPAVVGMREPVLCEVANVLTSVFYRRLLSDLQSRLAGPDTSDWIVRLVVEARTQIARRKTGMDPASTKEWTFPVAYVSAQPFQLVATAASANHVLELEGLRQMNDRLPPGAGADGLRDQTTNRTFQLLVRSVEA